MKLDSNHTGFDPSAVFKGMLECQAASFSSSSATPVHSPGGAYIQAGNWADFQAGGMALKRFYHNVVLKTLLGVGAW